MSLSSESEARISVPVTDDVSLFMVIGFVDKVRDGHKYTLEASTYRLR